MFTVTQWYNKTKVWKSPSFSHIVHLCLADLCDTHSGGPGPGCTVHNELSTMFQGQGQTCYRTPQHKVGHKQGYSSSL